MLTFFEASVNHYRTEATFESNANSIQTVNKLRTKPLKLTNFLQPTCNPNHEIACKSLYLNGGEGHRTPNPQLAKLILNSDFFTTFSKWKGAGGQQLLNDPALFLYIEKIKRNRVNLKFYKQFLSGVSIGDSGGRYKGRVKNMIQAPAILLIQGCQFRHCLTNLFSTTYKFLSAIFCNFVATFLQPTRTAK